MSRVPIELEDRWTPLLLWILGRSDRPFFLSANRNALHTVGMRSCRFMILIIWNNKHIENVSPKIEDRRSLREFNADSRMMLRGFLKKWCANFQ